MRAEQLTRLIFEDDLDQPLILAERNGLAITHERKSSDPNIELLLLRGLFGETNRGDLRRAIGADRDQPFVHGMRLEALDRFDADNALVFGLVRKQRRPRYVADGVDARHTGTVERIDHDGPPLGFHADLFKAEILDVADNADGGDDALDIERLCPTFALEDRGHAIGLLLQLGDLGIGQDLDALFLELLAGKRRNLRVFRRQYLWQYLDHRHLGAEVAIERSKLDPDRTRPHHQKRFRHALRQHGLKVRPDQLLVRFEPRQHPRACAGSKNDVLRLIAVGAERTFGRLGLAGPDRDLARRVNNRLAPDDGHLVLPHQKADTVIEPLRHHARSLDDGSGIVADVLGREAVVLRVLHVVEDLGRAQQRLGRDAAPVETNAAKIISFDNRRLEPELCRADRGDVAAGPRADDDDVERIWHLHLHDSQTRLQAKRARFRR